MTDNDAGRVVAQALHAVVQDHGWIAATNPTRLRAALSDVLGASAGDVRAQVDALVVAVQEGVPQRLREVGRDQAPAVAPELVGTLQDWGYDDGLARWAVDAWAVVLPERTIVPQTFSAPATDPGPAEQPVTEAPPVQPAAPPAEPQLPLTPTDLPVVASTSLPPESEPVPQPEPEPEPEPLPAPITEPEPEPVAEPEPLRTSLPPAASVPPPVGPELTALPPAVVPTPERTDLPPRPAPAPERTDLPRPAGEQAPPPSPPASDPTPQGSGGKRKGVLVAGTVAALVLAGGGVAALTLSGDDEPETATKNTAAEPDYTFNGRPVLEPEEVLSEADAALRSGLVARQGKAQGPGHCFFTTPAEGTDEGGEVGASLLCGPLTTLDGATPTQPFVRLALTATPEDDGTRLTAAALERDTPVAALPANTSLDRPDDVAVPELPRPAEVGRVVAASGVAPRRLPGTLAMGSRTGGVRVTALSSVYRFGTGDQARSRPADGRLLAFSIGRWRCEVGGCPAPSKLGLQVAIGGKAPQPLPRSGSRFVVSAPESAAVDLVMRRDGLTQRISLVDAEPAKGNIEVLARPDTRSAFDFSRDVTQQFYEEFADLNGNGFTRAPMDISVRSSRLAYFVAGRKAGAADQAFAVVDVSFVRPQPYSASGARRSFPAAALTLRFDGKTRSATYLPGESRPVFVVPADLTRATLEIGGTYFEDTNAGPKRTTVPVVKRDLVFK